MPTFPCDGPDEAQQLSGYGRAYLAFGQASRLKAPAAGVVAVVTQKETGKPLPHAPLGVHEVFARPFQSRG